MKATLGIIAALVVVVAVTGMEQAYAAVEEYHNYDVKNVVLDGWFWGTGNIKAVESWATVNSQIKHIDFDYTKVGKVIFAQECQCNVRMVHAFFHFPLTRVDYGGWASFFHMCVKNEISGQQTCSLGNLGYSPGLKVRIPG